MRVVAGIYKGRILNSPKGVEIRLTSQKVKQALFSILGQGISGSSFLDLFAGSGSVGIEAKSRGAKQVYLAENNRVCIRTIEENLGKLKIQEGQIRLLPVDVEVAIKLLERRKQKFDFVFLDPPYNKGQPYSYTQGRSKLKNSLINLSRYDILDAQSVVIVEHAKSDVLPHLLGRLRLMFSKQYGDTVLSFYQIDLCLRGNGLAGLYAQQRPQPLKQRAGSNEA